MGDAPSADEKPKNGTSESSWTEEKLVEVEVKIGNDEPKQKGHMLAYRAYLQGDASATSLKLVETLQKMVASKMSDKTISTYVDRTLTARINAERREISKELSELDIPVDAPEIFSASRMSPSSAARQIIAFSRKIFVQAVKDRIEDPNGYGSY